MFVKSLEKHRRQLTALGLQPEKTLPRLCDPVCIRPDHMGRLRVMTDFSNLVFNF